MNCNNHRIGNIYTVLHTVTQQLEQTTNYVERIFALQNTAVILKMLTDYRVIGEEIERELSIPKNFSNRRITAYNTRIKTLLSENIRNMETTVRWYSTLKLHE